MASLKNLKIHHLCVLKKNNSTRETLRGNFSDLSVMFSCDNHLAFIPSLNKGFATVFLKEGIQISDNNRLQLMYASEERPPISSAALRSFQVEFVGDEINDFEFKFDPFSHKYYATFLLDLLSKGHIKMSFNVYLALKYLSEGRPRINFKSVKLNFKDNELQGFVFRDVDDAKKLFKVSFRVSE